MELDYNQKQEKKLRKKKSSPLCQASCDIERSWDMFSSQGSSGYHQTHIVSRSCGSCVIDLRGQNKKLGEELNAFAAVQVFHPKASKTSRP